MCVCDSVRECVSEKVNPCVRVRESMWESGGKFVYTQ